MCKVMRVRLSCCVLAGSVAVLSGCSHCLSVQVADVSSGYGIENIRIERFRPASALEKLTNPVAVFYSPLTRVASGRTDSGGHATFPTSSSEDQYCIHFPPDVEAANVTIWGFAIRATAPPQSPEPTIPGWVCSVWLEGRKVRSFSERIRDYSRAR